MARILPPLWLFGAVLYTAGTLLVVQSYQDQTDLGSVVIPINETVKAKQLPTNGARAALPPLPRPDIKHLRLGQWVQIGRYTAVLHAFPGCPGHVLGGYPVGEPFRVVALEGDYARIQDLASGQFGWMRKADLTPYTDGYRPHRVMVAPQVAAAIPFTTPHVTEQKVAAAVPTKPLPVSQRQPYALGPAPEAEAQAPAAETQENARQPLRVALNDSLGSIMQRAFGGAR
jgi:hypothetical protein